VTSFYQSHSFYELQAANRRKTTFLIVAFLVLFAALGYGFDWFFGVGMHRGGLSFPLPIFCIIGFFLGAASASMSYFNGASQVLNATHAVPADPSVPAQKQLMNVVDEMRLASGLPPIPVYVVPDPDPNAFAVGRDPQHASIAVTQGLLDTLDREELQGVIGHELSHVKNLDVRTMTLVAALYGGLVLLSDMGTRSMRWGRMGGDRGRGGRGGGGIIMLLLWLFLLILAPILGRLLALAVSRSREYDADASSAEMTRNPLGLASALRKIEAATEPTRSIGRGAAHLCIADPRGHELNQSENGWANLWGTHPPIQKRISLLESMAGVVTADAPEAAPRAATAAGGLG